MKLCLYLFCLLVLNSLCYLTNLLSVCERVKFIRIYLISRFLIHLLELRLSLLFFKEGDLRLLKKAVHYVESMFQIHNVLRQLVCEELI